MTRIRVVKSQRQWARAEVVELVTASPDRVVPPCVWFTRCGRCAYQYIAYARQLTIKTAQVEEALRRIGKFTNPPLEEHRRKPPCSSIPPPGDWLRPPSTLYSPHVLCASSTSPAIRRRWRATGRAWPPVTILSEPRRSTCFPQTASIPPDRLDRNRLPARGKNGFRAAAGPDTVTP